MSSNASQPTAAVRLVRAERELELEMFDRLPKRWKRLVGSLPVPQAIGPIMEYIVVLGDDKAYAAVIAAFRQGFPGWGPEPEREGRNRPARVRTRSFRRSSSSATLLPHITNPAQVSAK